MDLGDIIRYFLGVLKNPSVDVDNILIYKEKKAIFSEMAILMMRSE